MSDLVVIFRTHSDIEASIVRGLLETHGIRSLVSSDVPHSIFPLSIDGLGEVRIAVHPEQADEARRVIAGHRSEVPAGTVVPLGDEFTALQQRVSYRFRDAGLLEHALTHRSHAHEDVSGGVRDNESLEFLGDAVLGLLITDRLFREFPEWDEGQKSKMKASLVSMQSLARIAERLGLGQYLLLGRGEEKTGGRQKMALLADTLEALIAAVYLDGGLDAARAFVLREFEDLIEQIRQTGRVEVATDYKSALQEWLQSHDRPLPEYRITGEIGPDHRKLFQVAVMVRGDAVARAEGRSKKEAEQRAARAALAALEVRARET